MQHLLYLGNVCQVPAGLDEAGITTYLGSDDWDYAYPGDRVQLLLPFPPQEKQP